MASLPVVDIGPFLQDRASRAAAEVVEELRQHLHRTGFLYLTGHGVDPELEQRLLSVAGRFFALPEAERRSLAIVNSAAFRGYTILGDERTGGTADWRDQLDFGPEQPAPPTGHDGPAWLRLRGPNQWPPALPEMAAIALEWLDAMHRLGVEVVRAIALGLGQPLDRFAAGFLPEHDLHAKIIRYPSTGGGASDQGVGLHHDSGVATFILQDQVPGLQVRVDDEFVDAAPMPGSYILNLGAMMQAATGGYLRATPHRVVSPDGPADRLSVALFFNPTFESTFEPVALPAALASGQRPDLQDLAGDRIHTVFGENNLKVRLRSHPDVAATHYADVV